MLLYPTLAGFVLHIGTLDKCLRHLTSYCPDSYRNFRLPEQIGGLTMSECFFENIAEAYCNISVIGSLCYTEHATLLVCTLQLQYFKIF